MGLRRLAFDTEGDDLEETCSVTHCIVTQDLDTGDVNTFNPDQIEDGVRWLSTADELWGHNIVGYDVPVLRRLYGFEPRAVLMDTLLASRQAYPGYELRNRDFTLVRRGQLPPKLAGLHSLLAWGHRLGLHKDAPPKDYKVYTPETLTYCVRDVALTAKLVSKLLQKTTRKVIKIESEVGVILFEQHKRGVAFNVAKAVALAGQLAQRREELKRELCLMFQPWYAPKGKLVTPKRNMVSKRYVPGDSSYKNVVAGCDYQNVGLVEFNPASGEHVARVLQRHRGWEPQDFTDGGLPKTEEKILADLPWPECKLFVEFSRIKKLLGYISEGDQAWLKLERNGRIHGRVHATGTVTNRMSHVSPNLGQVPKVGKPFGAECRALFEASPGMVLVGADASGLQLRMLANYLHKYDGGAFANLVENDGDVHVYFQEGTGLIRRENQKTVTYAWLFGAGDYKIGTIVIFDLQNSLELGLWSGVVPSLKEARTIGRRARAGLEAKLGMKGLNANLERATKRGYVTSLDGRSIPVLSRHKALNTLLMGGEAVVMKRALLIAAPRVRDVVGYFVLNVHDEWQVETQPEHADTVGKLLVESIRQAGEELGLKCKLDGKYKVGQNWSETH